MEEGEYRCWEELIPDTLGLIFSFVSLQEILTVVPRVCKSWGKVVSGPYCWQEIDIQEWSRHCPPQHLDRMLEMLITRSSGSLRKLSVSNLRKDSSLSFIANHAGSLQTLNIPSSDISDLIMDQVAGRLSSITELDISYCTKLGSPALEAIGRNCKSLKVLKRVLHPLDVEEIDSQDDEALAIAATMPKLKHLEVAYLRLSTNSVREIISNCKHLELLDLRGCWDVKLDDKFLKENFPKLKVLGPFVDDDDMDYWDDCSYYSDSSGYLAWDFVAGGIDDYDDLSSDEVWDDDEQRLEELEMRFYEGLNEADVEWPPYV